MNSNGYGDDAATRGRESWRNRWLERGLRPLQVAEYTYERADGLAVVRKVKFALMRTEDGKPSGEKTFVVQHRTRQSVILKADKWEPGVGREGWETDLLYNRVSLEKALAAGEDILVCEGEKDADSAVQAGWGVATSHYQGAAGMRPEQAAVLARAGGFIYICVDQDVTGAQLAWHNAVQMVGAGLSPRHIQFLAPAVEGVGADVTDHIRAGLGPSDMRAVRASEIKAVIDEHGELPRGSGGRFGYGWSYEVRELGEQLGTHGDGWKVQRG